MRIALDVSSAARPQATGVATYIRRLTAAFARVGTEHHFTLVRRASRPKNIFYPPPLPAANFSRKLLFEGLHPFLARSIDVFHGLDSRLPGAWLKAPLAVTIHDVFSVLQSTQFAPPEFRKLKTGRYRELARRADRIICMSNAVKQAVLELLHPDPAKLRVVYEGGGEHFYPRPPEEIQALCAKYGLRQPYCMLVGSINKRKNLPAQIQAFALAREKYGGEAILAIAGRMGFGGAEIRAAAEKSAAGPFLKFLGYVPEEDLPALYCGARALLFATLYEGFGIPAVEAFSCGCPVLGATVGALPEVIGDAGLLANPNSPEAIAAQLERLLRDEELWNSCRKKGLERAKLFSWDKAATEYLAIYKEMKR
jgi:glycosyltransferase involved in cell wall biosynthesis